jgi:hypothetical protein
MKSLFHQGIGLLSRTIFDSEWDICKIKSTHHQTWLAQIIHLPWITGMGFRNIKTFPICKPTAFHDVDYVIPAMIWSVPCSQVGFQLQVVHIHIAFQKFVTTFMEKLQR